MMALSESASKQLEALYQKYRDALPGKNELIKEALGKAVSQKYSVESVKEIRLIVHNLAGSAAMHGFNEVSSCARIVDKHIGRDTIADTSDKTWQVDLERHYLKLSDAILNVTGDENSDPA